MIQSDTTSFATDDNKLTSMLIEIIKNADNSRGRQGDVKCKNTTNYYNMKDNSIREPGRTVVPKWYQGNTVIRGSLITACFSFVLSFSGQKERTIKKHYSVSMPLAKRIHFLSS